MRAGDLRHSITIERAAEAQDSFGATVRTWSTVATVWAAIEPAGGGEQVRGDQVEAEVTHRVRIRGGIAVLPKDRVKFGARVLQIKSVQNVAERNIALVLDCAEEV